MYQATRIRLARKPGQQFSTDDFTSETLQLEEPSDGEVICETHYISLDPYLAGLMRAWQGPQRDWSEGIIVGRMVGKIIASKDPAFAKGDWVSGDSRWQSIEIIKGKHLQKIQPEDGIPASAFLGVLGSSGITAWVGINRVLKLEAGQTLSISSAAGAVGAIAGQLAKALGANVIGIAGGAQKCEQVVASLGFDACVDHSAADFEAQLAAVAKDGIHAHYENVGAKTLDPVLALMNDHGRIALCGLIAHYLDNDAISLRNFRKLLTSGLTLEGFRVYDYEQHTQQAKNELLAAIKAGDISVRETVTNGLDNAPAAYISMLGSGGTGKHLIYCAG
jgi:hypothetical protein